MLKTYLFDLDDTLIDTKIYARLYPRIIKIIQDRLKLTLEGLDALAFSKGLQKNQYNRWDSGELCKAFDFIDEYYREFEKEICVDNVLHDSVVSVFKELKKQGTKIGIVSDSFSKTIRLYVKKYGLTDFVDLIFSSDDASCKKNNPRYWEKLIIEHKLVPDKTIMIGDNLENDILIPKKLGFHTLHVKNGEDLKKIVEIV